MNRNSRTVGYEQRQPADGADSLGRIVGARSLSEGVVIPLGPGHMPDEPLMQRFPGYYPETPPPQPQQPEASQQPLNAEQHTPPQLSTSSTLRGSYHIPAYQARQTLISPVEADKDMADAFNMMPWPARVRIFTSSCQTRANVSLLQFNGPILLLLILLIIFGSCFTAGWYACKHAKCG